MKKPVEIIKEVLLDELKEQSHPIEVERVIFNALDYYAKEFPIENWSKLVAAWIVGEIEGKLMKENYENIPS